MGQDTGEEVRESSRREGHAAVGREVEALTLAGPGPRCVRGGGAPAEEGQWNTEGETGFRIQSCLTSELTGRCL